MKTSFGRIFTTAAVLLLISILTVGMTLRALVKDYLTDTTVQTLHNDARIIAELASAYYSGGSMSDMQFLTNLDIASRVSDADAVICDGGGKVVLCSDSLHGCRHQGLVVDSAYLSRVASVGSATDTGTVGGLYAEVRYVVSVPILARNGSFIGMVMVSTPVTSTTRILARISDIYVMVSVLVVLVCGILMICFTRLQGRPLREMAKAANEFGHGKLSARVPVRDNYPEDVAELALAFNNMAVSLEKSEYQRQEFVANVSHELKTPMTTIGGYIDGILDGTIPPERSRHYMQIVSDETKRLSRLVRSMLDISRLQDQSIPEEKKTRFDLEECMGQVLITFEKKITDKNLDVQVDMPAYPVFTHACQDHITQVIYNLIDNAVKFCPQAGTLTLAIRASGNKAYISVSNDGPTIPAEELPLVFDRFHKLDKARARNSDGWGLGLYIVKTIVCSHGEDISVVSKNGQTTFTFTMPLVN